MADSRIAVIAEKPDSARKIAEGLAGLTATVNDHSDVLDVPHAFDGNHYIVFSSMGHMFQISDPQTNRGIFPLYDLGWFPTGDDPKGIFSGRSRFHFLMRRKLEKISALTKGVQKFVNACDYDIEGEIIGFNILEYACEGKGRSSLRAKFSTLTKDDIRRAFSSLTPSGSSFALAGRMRHYADYLWGINMSRALTASANRSASTRTIANLSIGRVQGPTLAFVVDREVERLANVPVPRWDIKCMLKKGNVSFEAQLRNSPIKIEARAKEIYEQCLGSKFAKVLAADKTVLKFPPRYPFNLGDLQGEAYRLFRFPPSFTLAIAEKIYLQALISYPRTDSQKLPRGIEPEKILRKLTHHPSLGQLTNKLLSDPKKRSFPWQGPSEDPAHPAIFPTGEVPKKFLSDPEKKIFELIMRRFLNTFAPDAIFEREAFSLDIACNEFRSEGGIVIDRGWIEYYPHFQTNFPSLNIPLEVGEEVLVERVNLEKKLDGPPSRYSEGSLLAKMERERIGTKATRAETISTLMKRNYVQKNRNELVPEAPGFSVIELLREQSPEILSTEMTRKLETELESLQSGKDTDQAIAGRMMASLSCTLKNLRNIDSVIQFQTLQKTRTRKGPNKILGSCPKCKSGKLQLIKSRKSGKRFIGCSNYVQGCKNSSPAPPRGNIVSMGKVCSVCGWPQVRIAFSRKGMGNEACGNFFCPSRAKS